MKKSQWLYFILLGSYYYTPPPPRTEFRVVYRNHFVCPSACLSLKIRVRSVTVSRTFILIRRWPSSYIGFDMSCPTSVYFDIGISYLAYKSITMSWCVVYIHDPYTITIFNLKFKFIEFSDMASGSGHSLLVFWNSHTHESITMGWYITCIH